MIHGDSAGDMDRLLRCYMLFVFVSNNKLQLGDMDVLWILKHISYQLARAVIRTWLWHHISPSNQNLDTLMFFDHIYMWITTKMTIELNEFY